MKKFRKKNKGKELNAFIERHNRNLISHFNSKNAQNQYDERDVDIGKELTVKIESIGSKDDGIAKYKSYTVIVPQARVNDKVKVMVKAIRRNLIFAELKTS
ncbi:TRAM domain-containing protein [Candidatus Woesearchaeota archaeon]|nr:TRAM domain-containing protein [Candidatus Woesearchaeota archaeon]